MTVSEQENMILSIFLEEIQTPQYVYNKPLKRLPIKAFNSFDSANGFIS